MSVPVLLTLPEINAEHHARRQPTFDEGEQLSTPPHEGVCIQQKVPGNIGTRGDGLQMQPQVSRLQLALGLGLALLLLLQEYW